MRFSLGQLCALCVSVVIFPAASLATETQRTQSLPRVSVLDFGATPIAKLAAETLRGRFSSSAELVVADADLSRAAARGIGYSGSLNLTVTEARDLGAALAVEFYVIGDAQTLRRFMSPHAKILNHNRTGTCPKHQRMVTKALKHARHMALLPFVAA